MASDTMALEEFGDSTAITVADDATDKTAHDLAPVFEADPLNILRLFVIADRGDYDLHPDAFTAVTRSTGLITSKVRRDPVAAKLFLDVLARGKHTFRVLTLMNDSGVLGRYLPEWARIVADALHFDA